MDAVRELNDAGVSIWLDDLSRPRIRSGELKHLVGLGLGGVTTNPTIFATAFAEGADYRDRLARLIEAGASVTTAAVTLMADDLRAACDLLRPVHDRTGGLDGWVSIEVSPTAAHDARGTIAEAHHLRELVGRPNVFVKIPATTAGIDAFEACIAAGQSINVTLIFGLDRYRQVIDAYRTGLQRALAAGLQLRSIRSVASFFVSRVDVEVDRRLASATGDGTADLAGRAAIANARLAYELFQQSLRDPRWIELAEAGAHVQRPLWASTGVKDPSLRDTRYVETLVAPDTVSTMPQKTLDAVRDHGVIRPGALEDGIADAHDVAAALQEVGISLEDVATTLEAAGIRTFSESWDRLIATAGRRDGAAG
ncbi:transaldolase [Agromyces aerolatus]|uniref:transaldolase n=1 Tax=Agromyces sp. LY-1074 TaxID=3074080 RepID=UPI002858B266|nr:MULTISPECIES: transaldolase [unclassified Agromyces]MDR5699221.1 transaldolase [Agromyces sp. LY-1074]MDR5705517.1 transaldolase [Agromyces sp. LY-1358]